MLQVVEAGCILGLLALFFAYVLAPAIDAIRRGVATGRRGRPLSRPSAILIVYAGLFLLGAGAWRVARPVVERWVTVTAPAAIDRVFASANRSAAVDRFYARIPLPARVKPAAARATARFFGYVEGEVRSALGDLVDASQYVWWLSVVPVLAFLLLAYAPGFRRSALRVLPHGHLRWRGEEYLRDVNSALAGYVRAQLAASVIIGLVCTAVFALFLLPYAVSMGIVAGVLELLPVIGPLTVVLMAAGQAGGHALAVVACLAAIRVVQDYLVYPRLIRRGMNLSSAAVILAVWCGAALNGAAGVILAIPAAGFLSVSVRHWREYHAIERLVRTAAVEGNE